MNMNKSMKSIIIFVLISAGLLATACAPSAEKLNNEGNDEFAREAYLEALATYQSAQIESPELAEPYYNAANALYREGAYPEALAQIQQALQYAASDTLAQNSYYNLGNTSFSSQEWQAAVDAYRDALLLNPDDQEAKYNLELALQQLQQQQEQQQREQEQQQEQEQDQQDQQQSDNGESQENQDQQDQQDQSQDGQQGDQQQQDGQQDQSENGEGQQNEEQQQDQAQGDQENQDQNQDPQQQDQSDQGQPQEGEESQGQPSQVPAPGQRMTEEQAKQLLAAIAGDSDTLQERLGQMFVVPPVPPVQDW